ncbi:MAG TPA: beta-ketoacyl-[acyl-carrier-protein] synthase family protein [Bacteroidales bacterium]|nr:beta-ketoacyl-[acyl-carrier-protein] synthase family protein [Bacteroidales bacterium]
MKNKRVVVTGVGVVTPIGNNLNDFWRNSLEGKSGCKKISLFDTRNFKCKIAAEVKGELAHLPEYLEYDRNEKLSRATVFAITALAEAMENAKLNAKLIDPYETSIILGAGISNSNFHPLYDIIAEQVFVGADFDFKRLEECINNRIVPLEELENFTCGYNPGSKIASKLGIRGLCRTISTACASGTQAIGEAYRRISRGDTEIVITGGTDAMIDIEGFTLFSILNVMSCRNDEPEKASRPFDAKRDGFVLGEGAGILILESLESAIRRKADILGEVIGFGCTTDINHVTTPEPNGLACANTMKTAIEDAGISKDEVDYINAHGTSTFYNDHIETLGIKNVFGDRAYSIPVTSNKSMIGHLVSAAGAVEFISCLLSMKHSIIPPTINLENPDPACDLDYVPNKAREASINVSLSNSFGFGGQNSTLIVKKYAE